jgi:hypothetical protein
MTSVLRSKPFAVTPGPANTSRRLLAHAICVLRCILMIPVVVCVFVAWLAATVLATVWLVIAAPFRGPPPSAPD